MNSSLLLNMSKLCTMLCVHESGGLRAGCGEETCRRFVTDIFNRKLALLLFNSPHLNCMAILGFLFLLNIICARCYTFVAVVFGWEVLLCFHVTDALASMRLSLRTILILSRTPAGMHKVHE